MPTSARGAKKAQQKAHRAKRIPARGPAFRGRVSYGPSHISRRSLAGDPRAPVPPSLHPAVWVCIRLDDGARGGQVRPPCRAKRPSHAKTGRITDARAKIPQDHPRPQPALPPSGPQHFELRPRGARARAGAGRGSGHKQRCASCGSRAHSGTGEGRPRDWRPCRGTRRDGGPALRRDARARDHTHRHACDAPANLADWQEPPRAKRPRCPRTTRPSRLPARLDLGAVMIEALALALPDYPRAPDAELEAGQFAAPGIAPMTDEEARPRRALPPSAIACVTNRRTRTGGRRAARTVEKKGRRMDGRRPNPPRRGPRKPVLKRTCMTTESEYVPGLARPW